MLSKLRERISKIDLEIIKLISQRAKIALEIAQHKKQEKSSFYRPDREQEVFLSIDQNNQGPLENVHLHNIYREIMSSALAIEGRLKIAYLGPEGSFTHQATLKKFGHSLTLIPYFDISSVFKAVQKNHATYGVLPIENSIAGKVTHTLDSLLDYNLYIYSEVHLSIHHCLLGLTQDLNKIKTVYTHPQAQMQCKKWLLKNLPNAECLEASSTSRAAEIVSKEQDESKAAIASCVSADVYNLHLIKDGIEDMSENYTRFVIISKETAKPSAKNRTSIIINLLHQPGSLHKVLDLMEKVKVNLTSIESRPSNNKRWNYIFYIDFEGHEHIEPIPTLFANLKKITIFVRNLGSYPIDITHQ